MGSLAFIFSNSLASGAVSSASSSRVTDAVQRVFKVIAPKSFVATAVGEDYLVLVGWIRKLAHFAEFALFGALLIWCYYAYTNNPLGLIPLFLSLGYVPLVDECLQLFSNGRAGMLSDVLIDTLGGLAGAGFAFAVLGIIALVRRKKQRRRTVQ